VDVLIFRIIPNIFQHFLAFANIFCAGEVGVADKIANKIEHFGLDKPLIYKENRKIIIPLVIASSYE